MIQRYLYTVHIDDNSKLSGHSPITFEGIGEILDAEAGTLYIRGGDKGETHHKINWSRVRWYTREPIADESEATP